MTLRVSYWQSESDLDSVRNSCDVYLIFAIQNKFKEQKSLNIFFQIPRYIPHYLFPSLHWPNPINSFLPTVSSLFCDQFAKVAFRNLSSAFSSEPASFSSRAPAHLLAQFLATCLHWCCCPLCFCFGICFQRSWWFHWCFWNCFWSWCLLKNKFDLSMQEI